LNGTVGSLRDSVCLNYLEGLEWVFKYYSGDCPDWRWTYEHHYPPLLTDLQHRIPDHDATFIKLCRPAFTSSVQLAYVLPTSQFDLLPVKMRDFLLANYDDHYSNDFDFQWAFCRYFWEAHVCFRSITVEELAKW
jgi:5'-3' exonuclease